MGTFALSRYAFTISVAAALLAGCGGSQPPIGASNAMPQRRATALPTSSKNYQIIYAFGTSPDGAQPAGGLFEVGGMFYGTTAGGGSYTKCDVDGFFGCGTVFSLTKGGTEHVLHSFGAASDGINPVASLIEANGTLYGTTPLGGSQNGTVFSITPSGTEKVLDTFGRKSDGDYPYAPLISVKGKLYGTTLYGGRATRGTVFTLTPSGTEKILHSFSGRGTGAGPLAALIDVGGTFYGTTSAGGAHHAGTIFSVTSTGKEKVLHSFGGGGDGARPVASLIDVNGTLYGTTLFGGTYNNCASIGCGTVFSVTTDGTEKVLHSFGSGADGRDPSAPLVEVNGTLYGTTEYGGTYSCRYSSGCGTIFSVTTDGVETVLHSFGSGSDGAVPLGGLIDVGGALYGTTEYGGSANLGTVFSLTP